MIIQYKLHKNVVVELSRIRNRGFLKKVSQRKAIRQETLQKAKEICSDLILPRITIEVVRNIELHPLYDNDGEPYVAFYLAPSLVKADYPIKGGNALIVMEEDDRDFLATLFHELGHALEPKDFEGDYSELWAWFFAYIILRDAGLMKDAEYCWKEVLEYAENLRIGVKSKRKRKCLTRKS